MPELETQLREYGGLLEEQYPDITFEEVVGRLAPVRRRSLGLRGGLALAVAAALLVLVALGGVALLGRLFGGPEPPVITQPEGTTTTILPPDDPEASAAGPEPSDVRSVETSLGTWTWIRYDGPDAAQGEAVRRRGSFFVPAHLQSPPSSPAVQDVPLPEIAGLSWHFDGKADTYAQFGETRIAAFALGGEVQWSAFGIDGRRWWDRHTRTLEVGERILEPTVISGDPGAVEFRDRETGEVVARLEANDPSVVAEQLVGEASSYPYWGPVVWRLFVEGADGSGAWVEPPWQGLPVDVVGLETTADGFVAVATVRPPWSDEDRSSLLHTWRSPDGLAWEELGSPFSTRDIVLELQLAGDGSRMVMALIGDQVLLLGSIDGSRWEPSEAAPRGGWSGSGLRRADFGWVMTWYGDAEGCEVWISPNGVAWEQVPFAPSVSSGTGAGGIGCTWRGDVAIGQIDNADGSVRTIWVGRLEE